MANLLTHRDQIPAEFALVLSDQAEAPGLATARELGVSAAVVEKEKGQSKADHETAMLELLKAAQVTHIALAGFMRVLSADFISEFEAVLNIHPSLLPALPGLDTHRRALEASARVHGCTVHQVDAGIDTGPILAQAGLDVREGEGEERLAARVLKLEHALYPMALCNFLEGQKQNQALADQL